MGQVTARAVAVAESDTECVAGGRALIGRDIHGEGHFVPAFSAESGLPAKGGGVTVDRSCYGILSCD